MAFFLLLILLLILQLIGVIFLITLTWGAISFAPWVPCKKKYLERINCLAKLREGDIFYDLGCGDGRVVFYLAARHQIRAIGVEIGLPLFLFCKIRQLFQKNKNTIFKYKDLFKEDLSQADVVYIFGLPNAINGKLKVKFLKELKPGARVISCGFRIEGLEPIIKDKPDENEAALYVYLF